MMAEKLPNEPLTEAIFEVYWTKADDPVEDGTLPAKIPSGQTQIAPRVVDPAHTIFLGRIFERLSKSYSHRVHLPASTLPTEYAPHILQYQFWTAEQRWPVVQVGPGVLTFNDATDYEWGIFNTRCKDLKATFLELHPDLSKIRLAKLSLKYLNAIDFDSQSEDLLRFLSDKLHVTLRLPERLFCNNGIDRHAEALAVRSSFGLTSPRGIVTITINTAQRRDGQPIIMWETYITSSGTDLEGGFTEVARWLDQAHEIAEWSFHSLTAGDLERSFRNG